MDPLPVHGIIGRYVDYDEYDRESHRVLDRLRRDDPTLKELTIVKVRYEHAILRILDAIATNSSLKVLGLQSSAFVHRHEVTRRLTRALITNTSEKFLRLTFDISGRVTEVLDIIRASPSLEALTLGDCFILSIEDTAALAQGLCVHTNLQSLTIEAFSMHSNRAAAFAAAFQANQTIKTLIMRNFAITLDGGVSFVGALPHDHSLETIIFDRIPFNDDSVVTIIRTLCHKHLKTLSLLNNSGVSQDGFTKIVQILKENKHSFVKLDLFPDSQDSPWQNRVRLEIDMLTWKNYLQVEKDTWLDQFLGQDTPTKELLFLALERAKKADNERFSKAPDILFHLIKQVPDLIVQAICDGHKMSSGTMSPPTLMTTKRNSSASQDCLQLYESVTRLADGDEEAKHLLSSKLKEAEIEIHRMITNKRMKKDGTSGTTQNQQ